MKYKEKQQLISMSRQELTNQLRDLKKQLKEIALNKFTKPMKNVREVKSIRRKVAMIQTRLHTEPEVTTVKEK